MDNNNTEKCNGCQHQSIVKGQWCYMFLDRPEKLPCGQHDKHKLERQITGDLIRRNPLILYGITSEIQEEE